MTSIAVHSPAATAAGGRLRSLAARVTAGLMDWTDQVGRSGAAGTVRRLQATRVSEAARLRRYAQQWCDCDPRITTDLMAAADRHEREA